MPKATPKIKHMAIFTMDPKKRSLLKVILLTDDRKDTEKSVERLMGTKAEARFEFIQERAEFATPDMLDV